MSEILRYLDSTSLPMHFQNCPRFYRIILHFSLKKVEKSRTKCGILQHDFALPKKTRKILDFVRDFPYKPMKYKRTTVDNRTFWEVFTLFLFIYWKMSGIFQTVYQFVICLLCNCLGNICQSFSIRLQPQFGKRPVD